jgi:hypothetical protein
MSEELPELRASDADRERVVERLREAVAEGRLDMDEFEERMDAAYKSRTYADLSPLTRDLPGGPGPTTGPAGAHPGGPSASASAGAPVSLYKRDPAPAAGRLPAASAPDWPARIGAAGAGSPSSTAIAVMGGFDWKGRWTVARRLTAVAFWGGGTLDLREAQFEEREVVINCVAVMGGIEIVVPPGVDVQVRGVGIMGAFDQRYGSGAASEPVDPAAPRVVVTGLAFWGGVEIKRKAPRARELP